MLKHKNDIFFLKLYAWIMLSKKILEQKGYFILIFDFGKYIYFSQEYSILKCLNELYLLRGFSCFPLMIRKLNKRLLTKNGNNFAVL